MTDQQNPPAPTPDHPFQSRSNHEPAPHPAAALFDADPRLADGVDAAAAAVAIECAATQLAGAVVGGPSADDDAEPKVVRVRDAAIALARAAVLGARALGAAERPSSPAAREGLATPPTSSEIAAARERGEPAPAEVRVTTAGGSSGAVWLDAAVARLAEVIVGFDAAGGSAILAPADPEECVEAYGRRRHREARDALIELVRAVAVPATAGSPAPAAAEKKPAEAPPPADRARVGLAERLFRRLVDELVDAVPGGDVQLITRPLQPGDLERMRAEVERTPEERYRRALDAEAFAERAYRAAREATDTARNAMLSARAREVAADEEQRIRELCIQRAQQVGLGGAEVSR
ncbi:hypothetical protein WME98_50095 [Sorangium sp. So ce296]|uniref:hypothetical protein n=1 Tax=Sorangium sp. So ce296 TaxID=3133296 RepID=UPI003F63079A